MIMLRLATATSVWLCSNLCGTSIADAQSLCSGLLQGAWGFCCLVCVQFAWDLHKQ
jgi:hypothetical protein